MALYDPAVSNLRLTPMYYTEGPEYPLCTDPPNPDQPCSLWHSYNKYATCYPPGYSPKPTPAPKPEPQPKPTPIPTPIPHNDPKPKPKPTPKPEPYDTATEADSDNFFGIKKTYIFYSAGGIVVLLLLIMLLFR